MVILQSGKFFVGRFKVREDGKQQADENLAFCCLSPFFLPLHPTRVLGGGRIALNCSKKTIHIYGYSYGFGLADHAMSKSVVEMDSRYQDYEGEIFNVHTQVYESFAEVCPHFFFVFDAL